MHSTQKLIRKFFDFKGAPILAVGVFALFILESKYALRRRTISKWQRLKTNAMTAAIASVGLRLVLIPCLVRLSLELQNRNIGVAKFLKLSPIPAGILGLLILDYGNYRWHKFNHEVPWLWRLHQVHHADLDLDVSTALRFHVGEVLASAIYRGMWVVLSGVSPRIVLLYEVLFEAATNFHHSNLRLSASVERFFSNFIVTPRMHGIHHSIVREETDSNFCIVFTIWDRIHKTLKLDIPQDNIVIGIPYVREHLELGQLILMPFESQKEWKLPDGTVPRREYFGFN